MTVLDSLDYVAQVLLPELTVERKVDSVAVHAVCSVHHLGTVSVLEQLAAADAQAGQDGEVVYGHGGHGCLLGRTVYPSQR